jgi:uncharacterized protein (DUF1330 family)
MAMAKGYVIVNANVTDREKYVSEYAPLSTKALAAYGGRALARGGKSETLEGSLFARAVVLEFPDYETAVKWYHSAEYEAARNARAGAAEVNMMVVEGV